MFDASRYESAILRLNLCEMLAGAEPGANWLGEAFRTSGESKARVFLEQLGRSRSATIGGLPDALAAQEADLRDRLAKAGSPVRRRKIFGSAAMHRRAGSRKPRNGGDCSDIATSTSPPTAGSAPVLTAPPRCYGP